MNASNNDMANSDPTSAAPAGNVPEIVEVETTRVACDGDEGALGHPRVWLEMGDKRFVECGYCDRRFVLKDGVTPKAGH